MEQNKTYFFGYGAYRDAQKIGKILGHVPPSCTGAIVGGYSLFYQTLEQIPAPAGTILKNVWGSDFKAYTINPGAGIVAGVLWEIDQTDLNAIKEWEFTGTWREIISVKTQTFDGREVEAFTEKAINSDVNEGFYDGLNYPNNLNLEKNPVTDAELAKADIYRIERLRELRKELFAPVINS
jgi:hypothetical protein